MLDKVCRLCGERLDGTTLDHWRNCTLAARRRRLRDDGYTPLTDTGIAADLLAQAGVPLRREPTLYPSGAHENWISASLARVFCLARTILHGNARLLPRVLRQALVQPAEELAAVEAELLLMEAANDSDGLRVALIGWLLRDAWRDLEGCCDTWSPREGGSPMRVADMDTEHLINAIRLLERNVRGRRASKPRAWAGMPVAHAAVYSSGGTFISLCGELQRRGFDPTKESET